MGVLEDAIREHLDLKRKHGASDEELNRQEADALGPARRDVPEGEAEPAEAEHDEAAEHAAGTAVAEADHAEVEAPPVEDPDFGAEAPKKKSPRDLDFE